MDAGSDRTKQRISKGELMRYEYVKKYKDLGPCLLLFFKTEPKIQPIKQSQLKEFEKLLGLKP